MGQTLTTHRLLDAAKQGMGDEVVQACCRDMSLMVCSAFSGVSVWHVASETGQLDVLKALVTVIHQGPSGPDQWKPLLHLGHSTIDIVRGLVNLCDNRNLRPLHKACMSGHTDCAKFLLDHGADPWALDMCGGRTALHYAASMGHVDCIQLLLALDVPNPGNLEHPNNDDTRMVDVLTAVGFTPLHYAVAAQKLAAVSALLSYDANIFVASRYLSFDWLDVPRKTTALHIAAQKGDVATCRALLSAYVESLSLSEGSGLEPQARSSRPDPRLLKNSEGSVPYHLATRANFTELAQWLHPAVPLSFLFSNEDVSTTARTFGPARLAVIAAQAMHQKLLDDLERLHQTSTSSPEERPSPSTSASPGLTTEAIPDTLPQRDVTGMMRASWTGKQAALSAKPDASMHPLPPAAISTSEVNGSQPFSDIQQAHQAQHGDDHLLERCAPPVQARVEVPMSPFAIVQPPSPSVPSSNAVRDSPHPQASNPPCRQPSIPESDNSTLLQAMLSIKVPVGPIGESTQLPSQGSWLTGRARMLRRSLTAAPARSSQGGAEVEASASGDGKQETGSLEPNGRAYSPESPFTVAEVPQDSCFPLIFDRVSDDVETFRAHYRRLRLSAGVAAMSAPHLQVPLDELMDGDDLSDSGKQQRGAAQLTRSKSRKLLHQIVSEANSTQPTGQHRQLRSQSSTRSLLAMMSCKSAVGLEGVGSGTSEGSSEAECEICFDADPGVVIDACGHCICGDCAKELCKLHHFRPALCPFCRGIIRGFQLSKAHK